MAEQKKDKVKWLALESNPQALNEYISALGVDTKKIAFEDVYGTDPELLMMVPRPVRAVLFLFPLNENTDKYDKEETERIQKEGQTISQNLWFIKQTIGNACGTIGVLHSLANNANHLGLPEKSPLSNFLALVKSQNPSERAESLKTAHELSAAHEEAAKKGSTATPELNAKINLHFIAFVECDGNLYELDGRKPYPVNYGPCSPDMVLEEAVKAIQGYMKRDPQSVNFNMMALCDQD